MSIWMIVIVLAVVQVVGILTILRSNANTKKVVKYNRRLGLIVNKTSKKEVWEDLGLTEEEYKNTRSLVYGIKSDNVSLYTPILDDVSSTIEVATLDIENETEVKSSKEQTESDELKTLLGIENSEELEEIQKQIEENQPIEKSTPQLNEGDRIIDGEVDIFEEDQNNNTSPKEELQRVMDEINNETKKAPLGEGEQLFNEVFTSMNIESETQQSPYLFSDEKDEINPFIDNNINSSKDDEVQYKIEQLDENSEAKQKIALQLAELSDECEGTKNMEEIVSLLAELYELEGNEEDMKALKEEYKEYFSKEEIPVRVYEEDIIRVGKEDEEQVFEIPEKYIWMASNQIAEGIIGEQSWVGKCIGKGNGANNNYVHFRDKSQRIWINVEEEESMKIELGDLLTIFVNRTKDGVVAKSVQHIKKVAA